MGKITVVVMILTLIAKIFGYIRSLAISSVLGANAVGSVFNNAFNFPSVIFAIVAGALVTGFIPMYSRVEKDGEDTAQRFLSNLMNMMWLFCIVVCALVLFFTPTVVSIFYDFKTDYEVELMISFLRIIVFGIFGVSITNLLTGYLNIKRSFFVPALLSIGMNVVVVAGVYYTTVAGVMALPVSTLVGLALQAIITWAYAQFRGYKHKLILNFKDPYLRQMVLIAVPLIIGTGFVQINSLVTYRIATSISQGASVHLTNGILLSNLVQAMFATSTISVLYPSLSRSASEKDLDEVRRIMRKAMVMFATFIFPITVGSMVLSQPVIQLLYGHGAYTPADTAITAQTLFWFSPSLIFAAANELYVRVFYSFQNNKTPLIIGVLSFICNVASNVIFSKAMGVSGLAVGTSIAFAFSTVLLSVMFAIKYGGMKFKLLIKDFSKIGIISLVMGAAVFLVNRYIAAHMSSYAALFLSITAGVLIYGTIIYFSKIEFVDSIMLTLKSKLKR